MKIKYLDYLIFNASKIYYYKKLPLTDNEYTQRKKLLTAELDKAKEKYHQTFDDRYKNIISKLNQKIETLVSRSEYEFCQKIIETNKAKYSKEINEKYWFYHTLIEIRIKILLNEAKTVKTAVKLYNDEIENTIRYYNDLVEKYNKKKLLTTVKSLHII